jgi:hypothetical protein
MLLGVERREKRVLIGADAYQIDAIQRVMPVGYWGMIGRGAGQLDAVTKAEV